MTISPISFCGSGCESAGSIAYRKQAPVPTSTTTLPNDTVNFRGSGSETTGSIGHKDKPTECPECGTVVNFKGHSNGDKKGASAAGVIGGLVALTAATIIGLGFAHKKGAFQNLGEGWKKTVLGWLEKPASMCHDWCSFAKTKVTGWWENFKGFFSSKKD